MRDFLIAHEATIRLSAFGLIFVAIAWWEIRMPRRAQSISRRLRWPSNLGVLVIGALAARLVIPVTAFGFAVICAARQWGLFNTFDLPAAVTIPGAVILLDIAIYLQHRLFHALPMLWRLHRMHHADLEFDVTTGIRFHPLEVLLSLLIKLGVIFVLGPPAATVLVFELLLNASSLFNHGNVYLPPGIERRLRWLLVTPDMHRVHHSINPLEMNSNFGFNLAAWDRLFRTYCSEPRAGHLTMTLGLEQFREPRDLRLDYLLLQPLAPLIYDQAPTRKIDQ